MDVNESKMIFLSIITVLIMGSHLLEQELSSFTLSKLN